MNHDNDTSSVSQTIEGRHAVKEALLASHPIEKLFILRDGEGMFNFKKLAHENGIVVIECDRSRLDVLSQTGSHQGVIAIAASHNYAELDDIWNNAEKSGRPPLVVVCDGIEDPRNLGAIIRTSEAVGAHGLIIPKRRSAGLTATCAKAAAGAIEHLPVVRVPNIPSVLNTLKERNFWVYGAESGPNAQLLHDVKFSGSIALVLGSEGQGLGRLVKEHCDVLIHIQTLGATPSLNVSAAGAIILYEISKQICNKK